jgi:Protein of unknown function (DUF5818)
MALTERLQISFLPEYRCNQNHREAVLRMSRKTIPSRKYIEKSRRVSMARILLLALTIACSAGWLQAQDQYGSQSGSSQAGTAATGKKKTVQGCLQGSNGNYTLTDKSGMTYQLAGDTSKLSDHVGHEVKITGTTSGSSATSSSMGAPTGGTQQATLTVESMKHISKTCQSATGK